MFLLTELYLIILGSDHLIFRGGVRFFVPAKIFFRREKENKIFLFATRAVKIFLFATRAVKIFFSIFGNRYITKTPDQNIFFSLYLAKIFFFFLYLAKIFFSSNFPTKIFFFKKNLTPPKDQMVAAL